MPDSMQLVAVDLRATGPPTVAAVYDRRILNALIILPDFPPWPVCFQRRNRLRYRKRVRRDFIPVFCISIICDGFARTSFHSFTTLFVFFFRSWLFANVGNTLITIAREVTRGDFATNVAVCTHVVYVPFPPDILWKSLRKSVLGRHK
jgi:hypothetical protein